MRFEWTAEQMDRRQHFRDFSSAVIAPGSAERDQRGCFDRQIWKALAQEGFWLAHVPAEYGGDGGDLWDFLAGFEGLAVGAGDCGFVLSAIAHAGLVHLLLEHGTSRQRMALIPPLTSGDIGATASTEPSGGSHVTAITTSAVRADDGYLLSGQKAHITNAPVAGILMIVGRVPEVGARDITLFLVESHQAGVTLGPAESLLGQRTSPTGPITLDHVRVPADRVVGAVGDGLATLYSFLAFDRLMYAVATAAQLESMISRALGHATTRRAFGAALAEHELIQDKIVDMKVTMESSRWLAYSAADALARHEANSAMLASCAKISASEGLVRASTEVIQIFGHKGFEIGSGIERYLRDAIAFRLAGGTTEMQKKNIFKYLAGAHADTLAAGGTGDTRRLLP